MRTPQYNHREVCYFTGLRYATLRQWVSRKDLAFLGLGLKKSAKPGGVRLYTAEDVLMLCTIVELQKLRFPIGVTAELVCRHVGMRAINLISGVVADSPGRALLIYPDDDGPGWQLTAYDERTEKPFTDVDQEPNVSLKLRVDAMILSVFEMLNEDREKVAAAKG